MRAHRLALKTEDPMLEKARAERRRFRRVRVDLGGRVFVPADSREAVCKVVEMSPGGASVECEVIPDMGTPIILYVDSLGRFEGAVVRSSSAGFGVRFTSNPPQRERPPQQPTLLLNKAFVGAK